MPTLSPEPEPMPTIWSIPDDLWALIQPILDELDPPKQTGRKRIDPRAALDAIIFRLRSGCQWNQLPKEFPDDSSVHRTLQRWAKRVWGGSDWAQPDGPRQAWGEEKAVGGSGWGSPGVVIAGANVHDTKLLAQTLAAVIGPRPEPSEEWPQHWCLDKGYDNPTGRKAVADHGYVPHIRRIGEEKLDDAGTKRHPARRWVVERTLGWLSKCRAFLVSYDKKSSNYLAFLKLACALLWYRRLCRLELLR